ncbi:MAG TPA: glycosyltransferase [Acidimicrobiia bacterium]|nr:glycosyltransferase [Acidimicrobiia bacterium]
MVIITMNRAGELATTLDVLFDQQLSELPTVVVDNASTDGTSDVLGNHAWVQSIRVERNLGGAARNIGAEEVDTEFVAFLDDDTWPEPDALVRAVAHLRAHPHVAVVAAHVLVGDDNRVDPICHAMVEGALGRVGAGYRTAGFLAGASVVRSRTLRDVGGFHPAFGVGGEEELVAWDLLDAGWSLVYLPEFVVHHHPSPQRDPAQRRLRESRNRIWSAWMRRSVADAARRTIAEARVARRAHSLAALGRAVLRGLPMLVRERRRLTRATESMLRDLEA